MLALFLWSRSMAKLSKEPGALWGRPTGPDPIKKFSIDLRWILLRRKFCKEISSQKFWSSKIQRNSTLKNFYRIGSRVRTPPEIVMCYDFQKASKAWYQHSSASGNKESHHTLFLDKFYFSKQNLDLVCATIYDSVIRLDIKHTLSVSQFVSGVHLALGKVRLLPLLVVVLVPHVRSLNTGFVEL